MNINERVYDSTYVLKLGDYDHGSFRGGGRVGTLFPLFKSYRNAWKRHSHYVKVFKNALCTVLRTIFRPENALDCSDFAYAI